MVLTRTVKRRATELVRLRYEHFCLTRCAELAFAASERVIMRPLSRGAQCCVVDVSWRLTTGGPSAWLRLEKEQGRERGLGGEHGPANFDAKIR